MHFYEGGASVTWKKDASPLTLADSASHHFLMEALQSLTPEIPVISEESDEAINGFVAAGTSFWLVDPLDGTKEFIKGTNEFTVNVALIKGGTNRSWALSTHRPSILPIMGCEISDPGARLAISRQLRFRPGERFLTSQLAVVASKDHAGPLVSAMLPSDEPTASIQWGAH